MSDSNAIKSELGSLVASSVLVDSSGQAVTTGSGGVVRTSADSDILREAISAKLMDEVVSYKWSDPLTASELTAYKAENAENIANLASQISEAAVEAKFNHTADVEKTAKALEDMAVSVVLVNRYDKATEASAAYVDKVYEPSNNSDGPSERLGESVALASMYFKSMDRATNGISNVVAHASDELASAAKPLSSESLRQDIGAGVRISDAVADVSAIASELSRELTKENIPASSTKILVDMVQTVANNLEPLNSAKEKEFAVELQNIAETVQKTGLTSEVLGQLRDLQRDMGTSVMALADSTVQNHTASPEFIAEVRQLDSVTTKNYANFQEGLAALERGGEIGEFSGVVRGAQFLSEADKNRVLGESSAAFYTEVIKVGRELTKVDSLLAEARDAGITGADLKAAMGELQQISKEPGRDGFTPDPVLALEALVAREHLLDKNPELSAKFEQDTSKTMDAAERSNESQSPKTAPTKEAGDTDVSKTMSPQRELDR